MTNINFIQYIELVLKGEIQDYNLILKKIHAIIVKKFHESCLHLQVQKLEQAIIKHDVFNIIEELGDCALYITVLRDVFEIDLNFSGKITNAKDLTKIKQLAFDIANNIKKSTLHEAKDFVKKIEDIYFLFNQEFGILWKASLVKIFFKLQKIYYEEEYGDLKANKAELEVIGNKGIPQPNIIDTGGIQTKEF